VRTQLKFLFRKLKVSRQSELIRLLATTPASNLRD
jgi:DNA-binding CsgD family transcriptional regulator